MVGEINQLCWPCQRSVWRQGTLAGLLQQIEEGVLCIGEIRTVDLVGQRDQSAPFLVFFSCGSSNERGDVFPSGGGSRLGVFLLQQADHSLD